MAIEKIIFGAGCFWGVEATFHGLQGVVETRCGYAGGHVGNPTYEMVCSGRTGHIEVVKISFDPSVITLETLLKHFWQCHDPTSLDRQGADIGSQYRSAVFYFSSEQVAVIEQSLQTLQDSYQLKEVVATKVLPVGQFFPAEEYHQRYFERHGIRQN